jgi:hypothetical protein
MDSSSCMRNLTQNPRVEQRIEVGKVKAKLTLLAGVSAPPGSSLPCSSSASLVVRLVLCGRAGRLFRAGWRLAESRLPPGRAGGILPLLSPRIHFATRVCMPGWTRCRALQCRCGSQFTFALAVGAPVGVSLPVGRIARG